MYIQYALDIYITFAMSFKVFFFYFLLQCTCQLMPEAVLWVMEEECALVKTPYFQSVKWVITHSGLIAFLVGPFKSLL